MHGFSIRRATPSDYTELGEIMFEAVRDGTPQYTAQQRLAWVPQPRSGHAWCQRLESQTVFVAETKAMLLGFMSLADDYVDLAFIRPAARGAGMFRSLFCEVEEVAQQSNIERLWTHASLTAQPAFNAVGFRVNAKQSVMIADVSLDRFEMEKLLVEPTTRC